MKEKGFGWFLIIFGFILVFAGVYNVAFTEISALMGIASILIAGFGIVCLLESIELIGGRK